MRLNGSVLTLDPQLPDAWDALELRLRFRGRLVRMHLAHERLVIESAQPIPIAVSDGVPAYSSHAVYDHDGFRWRGVMT